MNAIELRRKAAAYKDRIDMLSGIAERRVLTTSEERELDEVQRQCQAWLGAADYAEQVEGFRGVAKPMSARDYHPTSRNADTQEKIALRYIRTGDPGAASELVAVQFDQRAYNNTDMNETTPADGGVAVPVGLVNKISARRDEMMLAVKMGCEKIAGKGLTVNYPLDNEADVLFSSVAEASTINQDAPALNTKAFTLTKFGKYITLSWELLRDEDANLEEFLVNWTARGWAGTHNSLLCTEVLANATSALTLDAAAAIAAGEIPELVGKVAPEYQELPSAGWLMNGSTFAFLQGLSGNPFQFSPTPGGVSQGGINQTLWGFPLYRSSFMPAIGSGNKSLIFGAWEYMAYREATGLTMLRDPYSAATSGQVRLHFWFDAVYGVTQAEALAMATNPTA